jgi:cephalosporin-C deacetylase
VHAFFSPRLEGSDKVAGRPLLVSTHGYGGQADPERVRRLSTFGFDVVSFDARGFGRSTEETQPSPHGYILTGIESPDSSILRGAVCDFLQARRAAEEWFGPPTFVAFQGFSFAGGVALMAAGALGIGELSEPGFRPPDLIAVGAPTFGDQETRARICQAGSGHEVGLYLAENPEDRNKVLSVLRYFDTVHFAPHVRGRVIFGVGLDDPVVPAMTVYAIKNALPTDPDLFELPCSHTTRREEQEWIRWESAWIRALRSA